MERVQKVAARTIVVVSCLSCLFLFSRSALAQTHSSLSRGNHLTIKPAGSMDYVISDKPVIIAAQVQLALKRQEQGMGMLAGSSDPESILAIRDTVLDGYVLLRTATHGLALAGASSKHPNPLLVRRRERVVEIRLQLVEFRIEVERASRAEEPQLDRAIEILTWTIASTRDLLPKMLGSGLPGPVPWQRPAE